MLSVMVGGFILLNITFVAAALFSFATRSIAGLFVRMDYNLQLFWLPPLLHILFAVLILLVSWKVLSLRIPPIYKAIYLPVPVATVLVTLGLLLFQWPIASYSSGAAATLVTLYYLYRTRQPWLYYFSVIFFSVILAIFTALGGDI